MRLVGGTDMDVSVHSVGTQQLRGEIGRVFPDAVAHSNLLAVLSFQPLFPAGSPPPDPAQSHPATVRGFLVWCLARACLSFTNRSRQRMHAGRQARQLLPAESDAQASRCQRCKDG